MLRGRGVATNAEFASRVKAFFPVFLRHCPAGTKFLAVEPNVRAGVPNVAGGSIIEVARLGGFRGLVAQGLAVRTPALSLLLASFNENIPLRNLPPVVNTDASAAAIQTVIENTEWASLQVRL